MKSFRARGRAVLTLIFAAALPAAAAARSPVPEVAGLIVKMEKAAGGGQVSAAMLPSLSASATSSLSTARQLSGNATLLHTSEPMDEAAALAAATRLSARPDVRYAVPNYRRWPSLVPSDPRFSDQWYLQNASGEPGAANLPEAWDISTGDSATVVAVLDTGILNHADFDRVLDGYDFVVNEPSLNIQENDAQPGRDNDPTDPGDATSDNECAMGVPGADSSWHGTLVTGVIAATADNFLGIAGIDHAARILPVRVLGKCGGTDADIIDGARWAIGMSVPGVPANTTPAQILNLSLGGPGSCNPLYQEAFDDAASRGVLVVVAAGNSGLDLDRGGAEVTPAECDGAFTIAATTRQGGETSYTNIGSAIALSAPGGETANAAGGILTTSDGGSSIAMEDSSYENVRGTSFATPIVAAIAALGFAINPDLTPVQIQQTMRISTREFPRGTTDGFADCTNSRCGAGLVDAARFLGFIRDGNIPGFFAEGEKIEQITGDTSRRNGLLASNPWLLMLAACVAAWRRRR